MAPHPPIHEEAEPDYPFSDLDTCGYFRTAVVVDYFPVEQVQALLPDYLELAPGPDVPAGKHPVVLIFGFEEAIKPYWMPIKGPNYLEYIYAIADTRLKNRTHGYTAPFFYMAQLRMNRFYPYILGRLVGYLKIMTRFTVHPYAFYMYSFWSGRPLAAFSVEPEEGKVPQIPTEFLVWKERMNQPIVSNLSIGGIRISGPLFTHYQFEWSLASFQKATTTLDVPESGLLGLPQGNYKWGPLVGSKSGTIMLSLPFEWLMPFSRKVLDEWVGLTPAKKKGQGAGQ
jgi:hypothetical protein